MDDDDHSSGTRVLEELRRQLADCLRREEDRLRRERDQHAKQAALRRRLMAAESEYRMAKEKYGLGAAKTVRAQRELLESTIDMLWAMRDCVRGPHMVAATVAAMALTDAVGGMPWATMLARKGNSSPFRRRRAINQGLSFIAAAMAGVINIERNTNQSVFNAAKGIVAEKYKKTGKSVHRWWVAAEKAGRIADVTPSLESFLGLSGGPPEEDLEKAREYLQEHLLAMMDTLAGDLQRGRGH
jgi:hypothetical protein